MRAPMLLTNGDIGGGLVAGENVPAPRPACARLLEMVSKAFALAKTEVCVVAILGDDKTMGVASDSLLLDAAALRLRPGEHNQYRLDSQSTTATTLEVGLAGLG